MKKLIILLSFLFCGLLLAQELSEKDMAKLYQEYMTPNKYHKMLQQTVGTWKADMKSFMSKDGQPSLSEGTSVTEAVFDGRYFVTKDKYLFNGMQFEGSSTSGYDNGNQVFVTTWIDNFGTGIITAEGTYDEKTNTITYHGKMFDVLSKKMNDYTQTIKFVNENKMHMEMFNVGSDGNTFKSMEVDYTRVK